MPELAEADLALSVSYKTPVSGVGNIQGSFDDLKQTDGGLQ